MNDVSMTYAELAERLGIGVDAARIRAKRRRWPVTMGNDGRSRVLVPTEAIPERTPDPDGADSPTLPDRVGIIAELRGIIAEQRAELEQACQEREALAVLREKLARAEERAEAARAVAAADVAAAKAEAAANERVIAELKAMLAAERERADRPWWRRLIGS
jgi:uncharacterized coiled-coil protein SlyX